MRSVYLPVFRSKLPGMFTVFDFAEPDQVNGRRDVTTVAPQALFLLNNQFVVDVAKRTADRILAQDLPDDQARVRHAYAGALSRQPTARRPSARWNLSAPARSVRPVGRRSCRRSIPQPSSDTSRKTTHPIASHEYLPQHIHPTHSPRHAAKNRGRIRLAGLCRDEC